MEKTELTDFTTISVGADRSAGRSKREKPFSDSVQMCIKCCKKLDTEGKPLRKSVKAAIRNAYGEDVELEKVGCFSLCPKGGQVLATNGANDRRLLIVQPGSNIERAVAYLLQA
jgi:hypothetical protein